MLFAKMFFRGTFALTSCFYESAILYYIISHHASRNFLAILLFLTFIAVAVMTSGCFWLKSVTEDPPVKEEPPVTVDPPVISDPEVRYTVTEEEWNAWTTYPNYTIEQYYGDYRILNKYTVDALQFEDGGTILFIGDKQYNLEMTDDGYSAYDCTDLAYSHSGLLSGGYVYDEFTYNEELRAYVLDMLDEMGAIWEVRFENGVPVSILYKEYTDGEVSLVISSTYT